MQNYKHPIGQNSTSSSMLTCCPFWLVFMHQSLQDQCGNGRS